MSRPSFEPCGEFFMDVEWCRVMPSRARLRDRLEYERVQVFVLFVCARCWRWIVYRSNQIFIIFDQPPPYPSHTDPFAFRSQPTSKCETKVRAPRSTAPSEEDACGTHWTSSLRLFVALLVIFCPPDVCQQQPPRTARRACSKGP